MQERERGSAFAMILLAWISRALGRPVGRLLLYPICVYFMIFSPRGRRASRGYLNRVLERRATLRDIFRHHYVFASTLLDRAFLLSGNCDHFAVANVGGESFRPFAEVRRGCLLLGSHLGSFDLARVFGSTAYHATINIMMYEENAKKFNSVMKNLGGGEQMRVIPIGGVDALLIAKERLEQGEMLAILGDRVCGNEKMVMVPFFGEKVPFPAGPFLIAKALKLPVLLFFGLYRGGNQYESHVELLTEEVTIDPRNAQVDLEKWVGLYASRLEHYCRLAPYNWFNFFDFWEHSSSEETFAPRPAA